MTRKSHLVQFSLENLAERIKIPTDHRMLTEIAHYFGIKRERVSGWLVRGRISKMGIRIIERAGYPIQEWLVMESDHQISIPHTTKEKGPIPAQEADLTDSRTSAMEDLQVIFDSGDPYLIPLIHSNLMAARQAAEAHKKMRELEDAHKKIKELEGANKRIKDLEKAYAHLLEKMDMLEKRDDAGAGIDDTGTDPIE